MSEVRHTPGPWEIRFSANGYPYGINAPNGDDRKPGAVGSLVLRWGAFALPSSAEALANARLIAAAPEMLALLQRFERFSATTGFTYPLGSLQELQQILAKATGA